MPNLSRLPVVAAESWDWQLLANCRGEDPNIFFHPSGERDARREERIKLAKSFCDACPVKRECADHALSVQESYGIWGGMSELEREEKISIQFSS